jgi:hypothetical protein
MSVRRGFVLLPATLAGCSLLASGAQAAPAKDPKEVKDRDKPRLGAVVAETTTVTTPNVTAMQVSATASCEGKRKAVGGGFSTSTSGGSNLMLVHTSVRSDPRSWTNSAIATGNQTLTTYVYCRRLAKSPSDVAVSAELPARTEGSQPIATVAPTCPGRRKVISGGFASSLGPEAEDFVYPYASVGLGRSWTLSGANNGTTPATLTGHAYCAKQLKVPDLTGGSISSGSEPPGGAVTTASDDCSRGKLSAGGFSGSVPVAGGPLPAVTQSQLVGTEWRLTSLNLGATGPVSLEAQGICL